MVVGSNPAVPTNSNAFQVKSHQPHKNGTKTRTKMLNPKKRDKHENPQTLSHTGQTDNKTDNARGYFGGVLNNPRTPAKPRGHVLRLEVPQRPYVWGVRVVGAFRGWSENY